MNNQMPYNMPPNNMPPNGYYMPPQPPNQPVSGCSITAMILGIVAILTCCCFWYISIPCALVGLILAGVGIRSGKGGKGMGIAGLVLSIISLVPALIVVATGAALLEAF